MHSPHADMPQRAAELLAQLRARAPKVHCITNTVAQAFTANVLLAAGGVPSMTLSAGEIGGFVARADALLVNLGTFDAERRAGVEAALEAARKHRQPWVLDPVFVERSAPRLDYARALVARGPAVVRLNAAEFEALAGAAAQREAAMAYARDHGVVVALSGRTDLVTDGTRAITIANGHPLMAKVTAMGCAGSALLAACLALERDAVRASASALIILGVAGELAARQAKGPGSFAVAILDTLYGLDAEALAAHAKVS
ncbi:MAG: hydroxyethylthiazole kinase [Pseudolabrys sp.]